LEQSGSLRINHSSTRSDEDKALSGWVTKQRGSYKAGRLSTERSRKLEQLQGWTWDPFEDSWWESFDELVDFSKTHGHCRVQKLDDGDLYSWMSRQRNDRTNLTTQKTDALEALPGWTWDPLEAQWRANYDALAQLASETGSSQLPAKFEYKGIKIGQWIGWMRKKYAQSSLPASQIQMLERLPGWTWDSLESAWQEMFSLTKELSETTGLGKVEKRSSYKGKKVGQWIGVQRRARASMTASRKSQLESLAGWTWDPKEHQWNQNYQLLSQLVAEQGFESIQTNEVVNGVKIGQWIGVQRRHRNEISEERRNALEALPGWTWSPIQDKRVRVIKALKDFYESNGHLDIPASTKVDGINLYAYASRLRRSKDKLEQSEREALETIGAWRWSDSPTSTA
jgi:hypothetical protein